MNRASFSIELRDFRQGAGLSRKEMALLLGVSDFTVRSWENGKSNPQSLTLLTILDRLSRPSQSRALRGIQIEPLRSIIEEYAKSLDLSPVEGIKNRLLKIERSLSKTVLKAAQTDFSVDVSKELVVATPFSSDLDLFEAANRARVRQILEDAADAAENITEQLDGVNLEQRYFQRAFESYKSQCERDIPNPRILDRNGGMIRYVFSSENISSSINTFLLKEIEQFLAIHDELMHGMFGKALHEKNIISPDKVSEANILAFADEFLRASRQLEELALKPVSGGKAITGVDADVVAIVKDIGSEAAELTAGIKNSNDPSARIIRLSRLKSTIFHGALLLGRLIFRVTGAAFSGLGSGASIMSIIEIVSPGSVRATYEMLRLAIPDLPPIPPLK